MDAADKSWTRRAVLRLGWFGVLAAGVLSLWPVIKYLASQEDRAISNLITLKPSLAAGSDWQQVPATRVWVKRGQAGYTALVATCTHLGCEVRYDPTERKWRCPCHGSVYDAEGRPVSGPAPKPLPRVAVQTKPDGSLIINTAQGVGIG